MRGFILQASYRIVPVGGARVPVVYLFGRLENDDTFLIRDDRPRPHFYIRTNDAERARTLGAQSTATDQRAFDNSSVCRVQVETPPDVSALRDRLHAVGIETFEADVRFATQKRR